MEKNLQCFQEPRNNFRWYWVSCVMGIYLNILANNLSLEMFIPYGNKLVIILSHEGHQGIVHTIHIQYFVFSARPMITNLQLSCSFTLCVQHMLVLFYLDINWMHKKSHFGKSWQLTISATSNPANSHRPLNKLINLISSSIPRYPVWSTMDWTWKKVLDIVSPSATAFLTCQCAIWFIQFLNGMIILQC